MKQIVSFWIASGITLFCLFTTGRSQAQIIPDATLPNNSSVTTQGNISNITGGTRAGSNLFHSFSEFSVLANGVAHFNNAFDIQNIISRVTGGSVSNIDGLIRANGTANLFLINPSGIIFGRNATLAIGGSFLGSTASTLNFADGTKFSASAPQTTPLLTISVPIGLGFGGNPDTIRVQGTGHSLVGSPSGVVPLTRGNNSTGLRVETAKTLALIGGNVTLEGGILTAPGGRIELGSVGSGTVNFSPTNTGWVFSYEGVPNFKEINLFQKALVDASGLSSGSIQVQGAHVKLSDGSVIWNQNQGGQPSGRLSVNASESLDMTGTSPDGTVRTGFITEAVGSGNGGEIGISTKRLIIQDGAAISTVSYSPARNGNLTVNASESLQLIGSSPVVIGSSPLINAGIFGINYGSGKGGDLAVSTGALTVQGNAGINTVNYSSGEGGNITLSTGTLTIKNGGGLGSSALGSGKGGDVAVNAENTVALIGVTPTQNVFVPSVLEAASFSSGDAGTLKINTSKLIVRDGGRIDTSTLASGKGGSLIINASDFVEVSGTVLGSVNPSLIDSSANILDASLQTLFNLPPKPSGPPGDVTINTGRLSVTNGGLVSVQNQGLGNNAGSLRVNANSINLDNQGSITAATTSGEGGNIILNTQNLQLRHSSLFTAAAQGSGNGGNISINTGTLAALENSRISADAVLGKGGNIQINAQGLFQSPDSAITASSQLGINGTVKVNTLVNSSTLGLVRLPIVPVDAAKLIAQGCGAIAGLRGNKFVVTGSGGLPPEPTDPKTGDTGVQANWVETTASGGENRTSTDRPKKSHDPDDDDDFVEATGMIRNAKGQIEFVANAPTYTPAAPWIQPASCRAH